MRELTDMELDAVSGGFLNHATGNGGIGANIFQRNSASQHAEVEESHNVTLVQAVSQSNSVSISNGMRMGMGMPKPPPGGGPGH
jgi:hypothetical protein